MLLKRKTIGLLGICLILAGFNCGSETFRRGDLGEIPAHPWKLFVPPWQPWRAYVSRDGDEHLYWEYSRLVLGEEPDLDYLSDRRQGDTVLAKAEIASRIRPIQGWRLPYRDFEFEYPPVALAMMVLPRLVARELPVYRVAFGIFAALLGIIACFLGSRLIEDPEARRAAEKRMTWLTLAIGPLIVGRFDIFPAALWMGCLALIVRKRPFLAGLSAGIAFLAKLYPALLLPPVLVVLWRAGDRRGVWRLILGTMTAVAAISLPFLALCPSEFLRSLMLYAERPFEVESLPGALSALFGGKSAIFGGFGAFNAHVPEFIGLLWKALLPTGLLACVALATRMSGSLAQRLICASTATVAVILFAGKVLSPQYLIWLLPLAALVPWPRTYQWIMISAVTTQIYYPYLLDFLVERGSRWVAGIIVLRNLALTLAVGYAFAASLGLGRFSRFGRFIPRLRPLGVSSKRGLSLP